MELITITQGHALRSHLLVPAYAGVMGGVRPQAGFRAAANRAQKTALKAAPDAFGTATGSSAWSPPLT